MLTVWELTHRAARWALVFWFVWLLPSLAMAQGTTSRLTGTVRDPSGAPVAGARVTLTNEGTNVSLTTQTTENGVYVFDSVQVGVYTVTVEANGFKRLALKGNPVNVGQPTTVNATLEVGGAQEVIEVTGAAERIQTSSSGNLGNLVEQQTIVALPIVGARGRNPLDFINFQPGVVVGANTGGGVHVHGARDRAVNFTLDGIDTNETSAGGANFSPTRVNPDALAEFRVITSNPSAENGRSSGAQVNMITRSGTNEFHGTAFWFYQTPGFNANEYANNLNGIVKRQFVQHIAGGSLGGPIVRNRLFFFTNFQALRASEGRPVTRIVYTQTARQGIFRYVIGGRNLPFGATGASVDANGNPVPGINIGTYNIGMMDPQGLGLDPTIRRIIDLTPLPNNFAVGDGLNTAGFSFNARGREQQEDYTTKVDYVISDRQTVFARVSWGRQDSLGDFVNAGPAAFPNTPRLVDTRRRPRNVAINHRWSPTSNLTNEFVVGLNRFTFSFDNPDPNFANNPPVTLNDVTTPTSNLAPVINRRALTTFQFVDNMTYVYGAHTIKAGFNLRFGRHIDRRTSVAGLNTQPSVNFSTAINTVSVAAFGIPGNINTAFDLPLLQRTINNLLGRVGRIAQAFVSIGDRYGPPGTIFTADARYPEYDFYIQDTWRLRPNLTIDYGLRWELRPAFREPRRLAVPDQRLAFGAPPTNTARWVKGNKPFPDDMNNLGPSVGVAWDPFGDGKTSVRVNYRLAYDRLNTFLASSFLLPTVPGETIGVINDTFGQGGGRLRNLPTLSPPAGISPDALRQPPAFSANSITVFDPNYRTPKVHQWALSIQRDLGWNLVLEANYIGRHGNGLLSGYNANQVKIFENGFLEAFNTMRPCAVSGTFTPACNSPLINQLLANPNGSQLTINNFRGSLTTNNVAGLAVSLAQQIGANLPARGFSPFFFFDFPQYTGGLFVVDSYDFSNYHAAELQLSRRFRDGLSFQFSYTLAKSLDTRSFDPTFTVAASGAVQSASSTPFDLRNRRINYARSDFDRTHSFQGNFVWELPFGRGRQYANNLNPVVDQIIGGWMAAGVVRWTSGRPFTVFSGSNTLSNAVQSFADCNGCSRSLGSLRQEAGTTFFFTADERARFSIPAPGTLGNTGRNFFTGPGFFQLDLTVAKSFRIVEGVNLQYRLEMQNATNTPSFAFPTAVVTSPTFGRIRDAVVSSSRRIQMALKFIF